MSLGTENALSSIFCLESSLPDASCVYAGQRCFMLKSANNVQAFTTPIVSVMFFGFKASPSIIPPSVVLDEVTNYLDLLV